MELFSTVYFGNILYYKRYLEAKNPIIEQWEHYIKQSYRNRSTILGANGEIDITIPVIRPQGSKTLVKDVEIDYSMPWQKQHLRSIMSGYKNSPFYDYIEDDLTALYSNKDKYLLDFNFRAHQLIMDFLGYSANITYSNDFLKTDSYENDFRYLYSPKKKIENISFNKYWQVFSEKTDFIENLSVLDVILCEGLNAKDIILNTKDI